MNLSHASGHAEAEALRLDDTRTRHGARNGLRWARSDRHQLAVFAERQARDLVTAPKYGWRRRWAQIARPDSSVVELDGHAIRRIDGALVPGVDPDPRRRRKPVRPCAGGLTGFVEKIEVGSVLGDESGTADETRLTCFDASIGAGQIDRLCRCFGCE